MAQKADIANSKFVRNAPLLSPPQPFERSIAEGFRYSLVEWAFLTTQSSSLGH